MLGSKKYKYYLGIDPDVEKSGYAIIENKGAIIQLGTKPFFELIELMDNHYCISDCLVVIEAGWLNEITNYHTATGKGGQRIALNVGRNQQVGILLVEYCKNKGLNVVEARPFKKGWKGPQGKITHEELSYFTGITKKTNQEARDAVLLAWNYAGLPIKIKVGK